jgi:hypothetical protein
MTMSLRKTLVGAALFHQHRDRRYAADVGVLS